MIMILAMGLRLMQWSLIDSLYRDSVNFTVLAERFSANSLRDTIQEPIHPLVLRGIHDLLCLGQTQSPASNIFFWELTAFVDGLFFTVICLWLLYAIGKHLHSPAAGLWAAFFLAIMPYGTEYSIQGLSELPFTAMLLASVYLVMKSVGANKSWWLIPAAGAFAALMMLTRKEGFVLIPIIVLYLMFSRQIGFAQRLKLTLLFLSGVAGALGGYYLIGGRFYWFSDYAHTLKKLANRNFFEQACIDGGLSILALHRIDKTYEYLTMPIAGWFKISGIVPAILFLIYLGKRGTLKINAGTGLLITYAGVHLVMVCVQTVLAKFFVTRYMFPICVILFPIAGVMMTQLLAAVNLRYGKPANHRRISLIVAAIMGVLLTAETIQNGYSSRRTEIRSAGRWIEENTPGNTRIFTTDDRVGFYCCRPWEKFNIPGVPNDKQIREIIQGNVFITICHKMDERNSVQSAVKEFEHSQNIQARPVKVFTDKKNEVTIYRLDAKVSPIASSRPAAESYKHCTTTNR
jgi:hypothetical protein